MIALALFALLQVLDAVLTLRILRGGGRELNPVLRALMRATSPVAGLLIAKVAVTTLVLGSYALFPSLPAWPVIGLDVVYTAVVLSNLRAYVKMVA